MAQFKFGDRALQHGFADDELADKVHNDVDASGIHAKRIFSRGVREATRSRVVMFIFLVQDRSRNGRRRGIRGSGGSTRSLDARRDGRGFGLEKDFKQVARLSLRRW